MPQITPNNDETLGPDDATMAAFADQFARISNRPVEPITSAAPNTEDPTGSPAPATDQAGSGTSDATDSGVEADATEHSDATTAPDLTQGAGDGADAGGGTDPDAEHGSAASDPPVSLKVPLPDGSEYELDASTASRLLDLASWAQRLTSEQRAAFAQIEAGQAATVSLSDFERFQAWQQTRPQQDADLFAELEEAGIDPARIAQLRAQQEQIERLQQRAFQPQQLHQQQAQQDMDSRVAAYNSGVSRWAHDHGITDEATLERLNDIALHANVIPTFVEQGRSFSPTGQLLRDADLSRVAEQAMNFALATDPELYREVVLEASKAPATPSADLSKVEQKKARAASLASAPSTAVPQRGDQTPKNVQELTEVMAGYISQHQGDGT